MRPGLAIEARFAKPARIRKCENVAARRRTTSAAGDRSDGPPSPVRSRAPLVRRPRRAPDLVLLLAEGLVTVAAALLAEHTQLLADRGLVAALDRLDQLAALLLEPVRGLLELAPLLPDHG